MMDCSEMQLLVQADVDGELDAAAAAGVVAHMAGCAACAALHGRLLVLSGEVRGIEPVSTPAALRAGVLEELRRGRRVQRPHWFGTGWFELGRGWSFGAGLAIAGLLVALWMPGRADVVGELVAGHVRALQPGHLFDVASSDQHTVKPWFDGRLDFAPPVPDLMGAGFELVGGRLDYLDGRAVAGLAYRRRQHVIDVFVWPDRVQREAPEGSRNGYNYVRWRTGGMVVWAVSDLDMREMREFSAAWLAK